VAGVKPRNWCTGLYNKPEKFPLPCIKDTALMDFVVNNLELFQINLTKHGVNTRINGHLHRPTASIYCASIEIISSLLSSLETFSRFQCLKWKRRRL
jgi:hypothetical protein